jgi:hypothetical protein
MIVKLSVPIKIEVIDKENEIFWRNFSVSILSFELAKFLRADEPSGISINPFKCSIWLKVPNGCQNLSHFFNCELLISDEKKQLFEF